MTAVDNAASAPAVRQAPNAPVHRMLSWLYLIGGAIGFLASFTLMLEKLAKLSDAAYVPTCSLNPVISCGSVMDSPQAEVFGFPNPLIGVCAFTVVLTTGVVLLSGYQPPRWFWLGMQLGSTGGVILVHWLIYQSLYDIAALCPYCLVVWAVTIPIFWYTTLHNLERGHLPSPGSSAGAVAILVRFHTLVLVLWYLVIALLILQAFWNYWTSLL